jgi:hypothetical protein
MKEPHFDALPWPPPREKPYRVYHFAPAKWRAILLRCLLLRTSDRASQPFSSFRTGEMARAKWKWHRERRAKCGQHWHQGIPFETEYSSACVYRWSTRFHSDETRSANWRIVCGRRKNRQSSRTNVNKQEAPKLDIISQDATNSSL